MRKQGPSFVSSFENETSLIGRRVEPRHSLVTLPQDYNNLEKEPTSKINREKFSWNEIQPHIPQLIKFFVFMIKIP